MIVRLNARKYEWCIFCELAFVHQPTSIITVNVATLKMGFILLLVYDLHYLFCLSVEKQNFHFDKEKKNVLRSYFPYMQVYGEKRCCDSD